MESPCSKSPVHQRNPEVPRLYAVGTASAAQRGPACGDTGAAAQCPPSGETAVSPGLVNSSTSQTRYEAPLQIDSKKARIQRLRRAIPAAADLIQRELGPRRYKAAMVTATYRGVDDFEPRHISRLLDCIRKWLARRGYRLHYVWVAELQQRGALHYHLLIWLPKGLTLPKPDKAGWWPHGMTKIEWARNAVGYMVKYLSKMDSKGSFPKGVRLSGRGGLPAAGRAICRWLNYPLWLKQQAGVNTPIKRISGIGLVNTDTGECLPSPWHVFLKDGKVFCRRMFDYLGGIDCGNCPYSVWEGASC